MIKPAKIQPDQLIGSKPPSNKTKIDDKDAILYALSIGFSKDPLKITDYKYTSEFSQDFTIFPTMGVIIPQGKLIEFLNEHQHMPKFLDFSILHLGQNLTMIKDKLQIGVQYEHERQLVDVSDKGKSAFMMFRTKSYSINSKGQRQFAFQNQSIFYFKGLGGFKYEGNGNIKPPVEIPKRNPDYKLLGQTYQDQAFLYRLNFDRNPLHIDPKISKTLNFQKPIIHGLASFGTIARVFVQQIFNNKTNQLKNLRCNFVGHVYPGETLQISVWKQHHNFIFKAIVRQRNTEALKGSFEKRQDAKM